MSEPLRSLHVPWIARTVAGPLPFRVCDWARDYSFHATFDDATAALPAAADAQAVFAAAELSQIPSLDGCGSCGAPVLVDVDTQKARCSAGCGWTGVVLRRLP